METSFAAMLESGTQKADKETPAVQPSHGDFVPAAQFLRERPLRATLFELARYRIDSSKRPLRALLDYQAIGKLIYNWL